MQDSWGLEHDRITSSQAEVFGVSEDKEIWSLQVLFLGCLRLRGIGGSSRYLGVAALGDSVFLGFGVSQPGIGRRQAKSLRGFHRALFRLSSGAAQPGPGRARTWALSSRA